MYLQAHPTQTRAASPEVCASTRVCCRPVGGWVTNPGTGEHGVEGHPWALPVGLAFWVPLPVPCPQITYPAFITTAGACVWEREKKKKVTSLSVCLSVCCGSLVPQLLAGPNSLHAERLLVRVCLSPSRSLSLCRSLSLALPLGTHPHLHTMHPHSHTHTHNTHTRTHNTHIHLSSPVCLVCPPSLSLTQT
jgi:hypothetical protein